MNNQYRKKPVAVEAIQFRAGEYDSEFACDVIAGNVRYTEEGTMLIKTLKGTMEAQPGDWIIRGVKGELYPCKPDIFAATYEPVQTPEPSYWEYESILGGKVIVFGKDKPQGLTGNALRTLTPLYKHAQPAKFVMTDDMRKAFQEAAKTGAPYAEMPDGTLAFINRGEQPESESHLDCPACGGSGHKDDAVPTAIPEGWLIRKEPAGWFIASPSGDSAMLHKDDASHLSEVVRQLVQTLTIGSAK